MKRRDFLKTACGRGRRRPAGARDLVARQGAVAAGDAADRLRERAEQHRHPWRRHQRAGLRGVVELLRPPDQPRDEDRPNGVPYYDRDKFKMELADDMNVGDMSATFKLKKNATFQDGTPVTAKDVKWSLDRAVTVGGFPTFQMGAGSLTKPEQFVVVDDHTVRVDFAKKDRLTIPDLAVIVPCDHQLGAGQEERHREGPLGPRIHQAEHRRQRRLSGGELDRRHRSRDGAQRQMGRRAAAEGAAHRLAHGALRRQPARAAGARRRRHLLRAAEQGFRRAEGRRQAHHRVDAVLERHPVHRHERHQAAVRQPQGAAGGRLCDPLPEDHGRGAVRAGQADVRRGGRHADRGRLAAAARATTPTSPRRSSCSPRPAIRTASRPRCRSTSASPASTSRSAC